MHISSCLHPKTIINPITGIKQVVACGKCAACKNRRASIWVQRLDQERYCWKYCWFFTLTYAPEFVPTMSLHSDILVANDNYHIAPSSLIPTIDLNDLYASITQREEVRCRKYLSQFPNIYYCSVYDVQCFMKRLRVTLQRLHQDSNKNILNEKDFKVRYFICSEYGPKGQPHRPHYHGLLFFNSSLTAARIQEVISSCWKFGFVDSSPVSETNSHYVAQYLNCTSHLPKVYEHKQIRPFILFSKCPPIGSLVHSTKEIQDIFHSCSPEHVIFNHKQGLFENVPLWRFYQDSLFPRLSYFSELSTSDRITLYRVYEKFTKEFPDSSSAQFFVYCKNTLKNPCLNSIPLSSVCVDYMRTLEKVGTPYPFQRWFNISARVCDQARIFGITINDYVRHIETFFDNVEKYNIRKQMQFEADWSDKYPVDNLLGLDTLFLRSCMDMDLGLLTYEEITILQSYNIDFKRFFSDDLSVRYQYYFELQPEHTLDFIGFQIDNEVIRRNNSKTKEKNETLNPNIFGDF